MGNLFGKSDKSAKKAATRVSDQDRVVLQMKQQRDKLKVHRRQLENRLENERQVAARLVRENKRDRALIILKKKKHMEKLIENVESHIETIERLTQDVEWAQIEVNVVQNLNKGNEALKTLTALMNIEDIEKMLDETKEAAETQKEINDLIVGFSGEIQFDDDELLSELDELVGQKDSPAKVPGGTVPILPDVPAGDLPEPSREAQKNKPAKQMVGL